MRTALATSEPLRFEFPIPENPQSNKLRTAHWAARKRMREKYWEHLDLLVMARRLPDAPLPPWQVARGRAEMRTCPVMDKDNANARMKWVMDWLQSRGYVVNDRDAKVEVEPVASGRKNQGITLTLEHVD